MQWYPSAGRSNVGRYEASLEVALPQSKTSNHGFFACIRNCISVFVNLNDDVLLGCN